MKDGNDDKADNVADRRRGRRYDSPPSPPPLPESPTCTILQIITKLGFQGKFPAGGGEDHEPFHQSQRERQYSVVSVQYT